MCQEKRKQQPRVVQVYRRAHRRSVNNIQISVRFLTE